MAVDLQAGGSRLTLDDFRASEVAASATTHRGHTVYTAGPTPGGPRLADAPAHVAAHLDPARGVGAHAWGPTPTR
jgi:hypothetical protein